MRIVDGFRRMSERRRRNSVVALACVGFFAAMVGVSYAAVPLYQIFCQVTGYGGTTQRADQYSDTILDRKITVRFDANTTGALPWKFAPRQREMTMRIGETVQADFVAENVAGSATRGRASFNVSPAIAGAYFNKVECFCFTDTVLEPGETLDMPVLFFVDPAIVDVPELRDYNTITLSYTFFPLKGDEPLAAAPDKAALQESNLGG